MPARLYYSVFYPGYLRIEEGRWFRMSVEGKPVAVCLRQHIIGLRITDLDNSIVRQQDGDRISVGIGKPIKEISEKNICILAKGEAETTRCLIIDYLSHNHRVLAEFPYSELLIGYEIDDPQEISQRESAIYDMALREFIEKYRYITRDITVRPPDALIQERLIVKQAIAEEQDDQSSSVYERLESVRSLSFGIKTVGTFDRTEGGPISKDTVADFSQKLAAIIESGSWVATELGQLVKAFDELVVNRNAKYALLEAFIAAESITAKALTSLKLAKGASKSKLAEYASEVSISYMLNVEVPVLVPELSTSERSSIGEVNKVRRLRNDVVHNGRLVTEDEALFAINAVNRYMSIFISRDLV